MNFTKVLRQAAAGALIVAMPVSTTTAAVRPNAAVPTAGSTAIAAQGVDEGAAVFPWLPIGIIVLTAVLAIYIAVDKDDDGSGSLSRG